MDFKLKNFGKIAEADMKLDGITVVCGDNNTGKSTVGKALFGFYNSLYNYKSRILEQRLAAINHFVIMKDGFLSQEIRENSISLPLGERTISDNELVDYLQSNFSVKTSKKDVKLLLKDLNSSDEDILNESVFRYFNIMMNGQIKRVNSGRECFICSDIKDKTYKITFGLKKCSCVENSAIEHRAYYINSPFALDLLNTQNRSIMIKRSMNPMDRSVIEAIINAQDDINADSMSGILDSVSNKKKLDEVRKVLKKAYEGDTKISNGLYYYSENNIDFDFRNISAGLKSFALIERMLETGALKRKDVLILDEPEIHLHSKWQIIYAELIVILQKTFDLTILLVTHSFQFLESLNFFMKIYGISDKGNYYIPESTSKGVIMKAYGNDALELKKVLTTGSVILSDLKFKYELENYHEEDN